MSRDALVVGINNYTDPNLGNLSAPVNDAEAVGTRLSQSGDFKVWRLPEAENPDNNSLYVDKKGKVSLDELKSKLVQLFKPEGKHIPHTALFYFSGHGFRIKDGVTKGYLATSQANLKTGINALPLDWLRDLLIESPVQQQIIWLDCCNAGELLNSHDLEEGNPGKKRFANDRCFIASCREFEQAYEGKYYSDVTKILLEGLDSQKYSGKWITNYGLTDYIYNNSTHLTQRPIFINTGQPINLIRIARCNSDELSKNNTNAIEIENILIQNCELLKTWLTDTLENLLQKRKIEKEVTIGIFRTIILFLVFSLIGINFFDDKNNEKELYKQSLVDKYFRIIQDSQGIKDNIARYQALEKLNKLGRSLKNVSLKNANLRGISLPNTDLRYANLSSTDLRNANLSNANLKDAKLSDANLSNANLHETNLIFANLANARLSNANLSNAKLSSANLTNTNFSEANLSFVDLSNANFSNTNLSNANLSNAKIYIIDVTYTQIKTACNWETASYYYWDELKPEWILDKEAVEKMKQDKESDPKQLPDCSRWE